MMKKFAVLCCFCLISMASYGQEDPFRIGIKFGVPNIVGLNAEYVTPVLEGRLAPAFDFCYLSISDQDLSLSYSYLTLGANYYIKSEGKGMYLHLGLARAKIDIAGESFFWDILDGTTTQTVTNLMLGYKSKNPIYFRAEAGYGILLNEKNEYDASTTTETSGTLADGLLVNIGFGVAF